MIRSMMNNKSPLAETVERTNKEYEAPKGLTIQYCALEIYETSDDYNGRSGEDILMNIRDQATKHKFNYAIMKHDRDIFNENTFDKNRKLIGIKGNSKKVHWHVVIALPYRMPLSDVALWFGLPDRFITKLKTEKDFDNMLVYLTHIKYPEDQKAHYEPDQVITNIPEYFRYMYDLALKQIEDNQQNIITFVIIYLSGIKHKVDFNKLIPDLQIEYQINDILKYFRIIEKLVQEHNHKFDIDVQHEKSTDMIKVMQGQIADLQHNLDVVLNENMELRGIGCDSDKEERKVF